MILAINWLNTSINLLLVVFVLVCFLLSLVVLMQRPKQEGLGAAFGSGMTDQMFGARTTSVLQKGTVYLATLFFLLTITLAILYAKQSTAGGTMVAETTEEAVAPAEETPAAGEETPAAGEEAPAAGEEAPAAGEEAPAAGEEAPATGEEAPATGEEAPATGEETPATGEETPVDPAAPADGASEAAEAPDSTEAPEAPAGE